MYMSKETRHDSGHTLSKRKWNDVRPYERKLVMTRRNDADKWR